MGKLGPERSNTGRARTASLGPNQERQQPWAPSLLTEGEAERPHHQPPFRHIATGEREAGGGADVLGNQAAWGIPWELWGM